MASDQMDSRFAEALTGNTETINELWAGVEALRRKAQDLSRSAEAAERMDIGATGRLARLRQVAQALAKPDTWAASARLLRADAPGADPDDLVATLLAEAEAEAETFHASAKRERAVHDEAVKDLAAIEGVWYLVVIARPDEAGEAVRATPPPAAPVAAHAPQAAPRRPLVVTVDVDPATAERRRQEAAAWAAHRGNGRPAEPRRNRPAPVRQVREAWFAFLAAHNAGMSVVLAPEGGLPAAAIAVRPAGGWDFRIVAVLGDPGFAEGDVVGVPALRAFAGDEVLVRKARFLGLTAADRPPVVAFDDGRIGANIGDALVAAAGR